jgi:hypothetical protein
MKRALYAAGLFAIIPTIAQAASVTLPFTVNPVISTPPSTGITCTPISTTLIEPVPTGTVLTTCTVAPSNWHGAVSVGDSHVVAVLTATNVFQLKVGATPLAAGPYTEVVTSLP